MTLESDNKEIIEEQLSLTDARTKIILDNTFKNWLGNTVQVDDVTIIGVRV